VAATMLLRNMPEPSNSQARCIRDEVQTLLQVAAVQQADSSASRRRGAATEKRNEPAQTKRRCRSISSRPLEGRRPRSSSPLTTNVGTTHDAILKKTVAVGTGTRRSAVTAPIVAGGTTAMRTGRLQSHQAHGCLAGRSVARHCPVRSNPQPASQSTMVKPNQSCGWRTSGWPVS